MAWLHAAPKHHSKHEDPEPRLNILSEDDPVRMLPEANEYLCRCFQLAGMFLSGGMGITALSWLDIQAFSSQSGYKLNGWESEQVIIMSRAYCRMSHEAKDFGFPAPYNQAASDEDSLQKNRDKVNAQFQAMRRKSKG